MKKLSILIMSIVTLICISSSVIKVNALSNLGTDGVGFINISPTRITCNADTLFVLNESDNYMYSLKDNSIEKLNVSGSISFIKYFSSNVYYSVSNVLYRYNTLTESSHIVATIPSNIVSFEVTTSDIYILTSTTLYSFDTVSDDLTIITSALTNAKTSILKNTDLYLIDTNKLYKVKDGNVLLLGTLSQMTTSSFELLALENGLVVLEKPSNVISLFNYNGSYNNTCITATNSVLTRTFKSGELFGPTAMCYYNGKVVITDNATKSIQAFTFRLDNTLQFDSIIVASSGADNNRLNNASDFDIVDNKLFIFADTENNRVSTIEYDSKVCSVLNYSFTLPKIVAGDSRQNIYVYDNNYFTIINQAQNSKTELTLNFALADICCDTTTNTYALDDTNNKLLKLCGTNFEQVALLDVAQTSHMCINASATQIYVLTGNTIYTISTATSAVTSRTLASVAQSITVDYKNNLYLLYKIDTGYKLEKQVDGEIINTFIIETTDTLAKLNINLNTGKFYSLNKTLSCVTELGATFAENLLSFSQNTSALSSTPLTSEVEVYYANQNCLVYAYPFNVSPILTLNQNDKVILLSDEVAENPTFYHCLITNKSNVNYSGYIQKTSLTKVTSQISPEYEKARVITAIANVYKYPTSTPLEIGNNRITFNLTDRQLIKNDVVQILSYAYDLSDGVNTGFLCVKLEDESIVYINKNTAINNDLDAAKYNKVFQPNAKLTSQRGTEIDGYRQNEDNTYTAIKTFESGKLIYLEQAFDTSNEYTKVIYLNSNNEQVAIYVLTKFVDPDDITTHQIIGLIILTFVIISSILVIIIIIKSKNKKI